METASLITSINGEMGINLPEKLSLDELRLRLQEAVNEMINTNFQQLVNMLYRIDVNERKLKYLLQENVGADAAVIIADLIIERQREKITARQQYQRPDDTINEDERW
jgi:uncharacterized protein YtpQ (UPF0354 family)